MADTITILIPAHNEAAVIDQTLRHMLGPEKSVPDGWSIMVAANGCTDNTVEIIRQAWPAIQVLELPEPSKVQALRQAMALVEPGTLIILDADIAVPISALRVLIAPLSNGPGGHDGAIAAVGYFEPDTSESDLWVRLFYQVWRHHPYFDGGKFGGCYALATRAHQVIATLPDVINDDEYVARSMSKLGSVVTTDCRFATKAPRHLGELIRVRSRVQRGNRQLAAMAVAGAIPPVSSQTDAAGAIKLKFLRRLAARPSIWPAVIVYGLINGLARLRNMHPSFGAAQQPARVWERVSR